jgi:hypothetical protein
MKAESTTAPKKVLPFGFDTAATMRAAKQPAEAIAATV